MIRVSTVDFNIDNLFCSYNCVFLMNMKEGRDRINILTVLVELVEKLLKISLGSYLTSFCRHNGRLDGRYFLGC